MSERFDEIISRTGTFCTQWDYTEDRFGEKDIIPFSISDMDFQSPPEILHAIKERTNHGVFGYTRWNHHSFKASISGWYKERFSAHIEDDWIVYSPSVIYTISKLIELLTEEEDAIVMQLPAYDAFFNQIKTSKRELLKNNLIYKEGKYHLDYDDLENKLAYRKTKVLLLCNPHNPTGRVWTKEELVKIIELCECHDVKVISDDIHMDVVYDGHSYTPVTSVTKNLDNVYVCTSASKTFNTPGLGGSYAFIPNEKIREQFLNVIKFQDGLSSASIFGILAIMEGYQHAAYWVDELKSYLYNNMKMVKDFIDRELPDLKFTMPESTYLAWIDCSGLNKTSSELQNSLVQNGKVGIMSGDVYGAEQGPFLRMNIGCPEAKVLEGLKRLKLSIDLL